MKQLLIVLFLLLVILTACKKKEPSTSDNPSANVSPIEQLPPSSTGWVIAPCKLIDEPYLRTQLKVESATIAIIPDVATNPQAISSCTYRWTKFDAFKIQTENEALRQKSLKSNKPFAPESPYANIVISYTGKYADAAAANTMIEVTISKLSKDSRWVEGVGDKALWNGQGNQLIVQKGAYVFYVQMNVDSKKNTEYAKQLAIDICKKI